MRLPCACHAFVMRLSGVFQTAIAFQAGVDP